MLNWVRNWSFLSSLLYSLLTCALVGLAGCTPTSSLPDDIVWQGYVKVTSGGKVPIGGVEAAQARYRIRRLGTGTITTPAQPHDSGACFPIELQGQSVRQEAVRISIHIVSRNDDTQVTPITFIKWNGMEGWIVSLVEDPNVCYRIE